ncbi:hypothetical protein ACLOJK_010817 [Asimina triloba]
MDDVFLVLVDIYSTRAKALPELDDEGDKALAIRRMTDEVVGEATDRELSTLLVVSMRFETLIIGTTEAPIAVTPGEAIAMSVRLLRFFGRNVVEDDIIELKHIAWGLETEFYDELMGLVGCLIDARKLSSRDGVLPLVVEANFKRVSKLLETGNGSC